ncbi:MAG: PEP-CTERM sorting domain-containing protein [Anaerohalosphaeraceae bacterium]
MKPIQRQCRIVLLALLVSPIALAGMADEGVLVDSLTSTFLPGYGTGIATVDSKVYWANPDSVYAGNYIYTYLISGSQVNLSFFSVELYPDVLISSWGVETPGKQPAVWSPVNNPYESMEALFVSPILPGETSATLWFISPYGPIKADGALAGITRGSYNFLVGQVLSPVIPEPATVLLLTVGGLLSRFSRKRKS